MVPRADRLENSCPLTSTTRIYPIRHDMSAKCQNDQFLLLEARPLSVKGRHSADRMTTPWDWI